MVRKYKELTPHQISQRQKQIDLGYSTNGYHRYVKCIKKKDRRKDWRNCWHPVTPDVNGNYSTRAFGGLVKQWRACLHLWGNLAEGEYQSICNHMCMVYPPSVIMPTFPDVSSRIPKAKTDITSTVCIENLCSNRSAAMTVFPKPLTDTIPHTTYFNYPKIKSGNTTYPTCPFSPRYMLTRSFIKDGEIGETNCTLESEKKRNREISTNHQLCISTSAKSTNESSNTSCQTGSEHMLTQQHCQLSKELFFFNVPPVYDMSDVFALKKPNEVITAAKLSSLYSKILSQQIISGNEPRAKELLMSPLPVAFLPKEFRGMQQWPPCYFIREEDFSKVLHHSAITDTMSVIERLIRRSPQIFGVSYSLHYQSIQASQHEESEVMDKNSVAQALKKHSLTDRARLLFYTSQCKKVNQKRDESKSVSVNASHENVESLLDEGVLEKFSGLTRQDKYSYFRKSSKKRF